MNKVIKQMMDKKQEQAEKIAYYSNECVKATLNAIRGNYGILYLTLLRCTEEEARMVNDEFRKVLLLKHPKTYEKVTSSSIEKHKSLFELKIVLTRVKMLVIL